MTTSTSYSTDIEGGITHSDSCQCKTEEHETIEDIVSEIRRQNLASPWCYQPLPNRMCSYSDRIEAAYNREREAEVEMARRDIDIVICRYGRLVKKLRSENERLLSALKPVLDACISQDDHSAEVYDSRLDAAVCVRAVREAKRVYGGGDK